MVRRSFLWRKTPARRKARAQTGLAIVQPDAGLSAAGHLGGVLPRRSHRRSPKPQFVCSRDWHSPAQWRRLVGVERRHEARYGFAEKALTGTLITVFQGAWPALVVDMSAIGVKLRLEGGEAPDLKPGMQVLLDLDFPDEIMTVRGVIRRRQGGEYSLFFPDLISSDSDSTEKLGTMLTDLGQSDDIC